MTHQEFHDIIQPKICDLWHFANKKSVAEFAMWNRALTQFPLLLVENAIEELFQTGTKRLTNISLSELLKVCNRMNGTTDRKEVSKRLNNYDTLRHKHQDLAGKTDAQIDILLAWNTFQQYQRAFGNSEQIVMISWRKWQDVSRKHKAESHLKGGETLEEVFTIYRNLFAVTDDKRECEPEVAPQENEVPDWNNTF